MVCHRESLKKLNIWTFPTLVSSLAGYRGLRVHYRRVTKLKIFKTPTSVYKKRVYGDQPLFIFRPFY